MPQSDVPAFRLFLLRHAKAGWAQPGAHDFDRTLDDDGFADAEIVAEKMADLRLQPSRILSSTAVRCRQTAEALKRAISEELEVLYIDDLYSGTIEVYRSLISSQTDVASLMIIGHNPVIEELFRETVEPARLGEARPDAYPPAGLAVIDFERMPPDGDWPFGRLSFWIEPRR